MQMKIEVALLERTTEALCKIKDVNDKQYGKTVEVLIEEAYWEMLEALREEITNPGYLISEALAGRTGEPVMDLIYAREAAGLLSRGTVATIVNTAANLVRRYRDEHKNYLSYTYLDARPSLSRIIETSNI